MRSDGISTAAISYEIVQLMADLNNKLNVAPRRLVDITQTGDNRSNSFWEIYSIGTATEERRSAISSPWRWVSVL